MEFHVRDGFNITPASEVMAILCMAKDFEDLKKRLGDIFVGLHLIRKQFLLVIKS